MSKKKDDSIQQCLLVCFLFVCLLFLVSLLLLGFFVVVFFWWGGKGRFAVSLLEERSIQCFSHWKMDVTISQCRTNEQSDISVSDK